MECSSGNGAATVALRGIKLMLNEADVTSSEYVLEVFIWKQFTAVAVVAVAATGCGLEPAAGTTASRPEWQLWAADLGENHLGSAWVSLEQQ
ncbi:hypothetical protein F0562_032262 [Nyssa sinensis]|uniref:Uncharacterized protein n=1 Tax=Nyssa sinensis TaxID=561372 RepID=A0A5J5AMJ5_9ASTE|nr:hypothetical protein F0562_032262 [Nyssa sinensis]